MIQNLCPPLINLSHAARNPKSQVVLWFRDSSEYPTQGRNEALWGEEWTKEHNADPSIDEPESRTGSGARPDGSGASGSPPPGAASNLEIKAGAPGGHVVEAVFPQDAVGYFSTQEHDISPS